MQTGLHFEHGQVYTYVIEGSRASEKEPLTYESSWTDYMSEILKDGADGVFGIVIDQLNPIAVKEAQELSAQLGGAGTVRLYTKEKAIVGMVRFQRNDLRRGNTAVFDYSEEQFAYYDVREKSGKIIVEKQDYTQMMEQANSKNDKDRLFSEIIRKVFARGVTSTVYLCGIGFEGEWFQQATRILCRGRRVFMGNHLFACGAAYLAGQESGFEAENACLITENMTVCQIGLTLYHHGRDVFYPLLPEGRAWFEAKGEMEIFVSGITKLIFELRTKEGRKTASVCMPLSGIKKNKDFVYKLKIQGEYISSERCKIKITDEGFGSLRPSSHQVWQQVIRLERSESHE